jgi:hypothetical protein
MFSDQVRAAVDAARTSMRLDELSRAIWQDNFAGVLGDDDAQKLAEYIHARRAALHGPEPAPGRQGDPPFFARDGLSGRLIAPGASPVAAALLHPVRCRLIWLLSSQPASRLFSASLLMKFSDMGSVI